MKFSHLAGLLLVCGMAAGTSCAEAKKTSLTSGKAYARLLDCYSQRIIPGVPDQDISTAYQFLVIWQSTQKPETFFWKAPGKWKTCAPYKFKKLRKKDNTNTWFDTEELNLGDVKKGDTLVLLPIPGGKFPIPTAIPSNLKDIILFKSTKSN